MKIFVVLGTTRSGSGAIFDYLKGRQDSWTPFGDAEYFLPQIPYGFMQLRSALSEAFHYTVAHEAIIRFREVANQLAGPSLPGQHWGGYEEALPGFTNEIDEFLSKLVDSRMSMRFTWDRMMAARSGEGFLGRALRKSKMGKKPVAAERFLPLPHDEVLTLIRQMHDRLFSAGCADGQFTLLNQAGSGWNPHHSTEFFSHRKVLVSTRDPRDQFAELKKFKGSTEVEEYVKWFRNLQSRTVTGNPDVSYVKFEDFVLDHEKLSQSILSFLDLAPSESNYVPEESEKNIGQFRRALSPAEIAVIESALRDDFPHTFFDV